MIDKLKDIEKKFEEINNKLLDPEVTSDLNEYQRLTKESSYLTPIVEKAREYMKAASDMEGARELMSSGDAEMKELAEAEFEELKEAMPRMEEALKLLLLPPDERDDKNVILEIRAGTGGDEEADQAGQNPRNVFPLLTNHSNKHGQIGPCAGDAGASKLHSNVPRWNEANRTGTPERPSFIPTGTVGTR